MKRYKYLIIGGGMTADSATKGIRSMDGAGDIAVITDELDAPYDRPPLSKGLWKGKPLSKIWRHTESRGVALINGRKVVSLDPEKQQVIDDQGNDFHYERLLLATGGSPKRHPDDGAIPIYYRTLKDYQSLRTLTEEKQRFVVFGGGFIGSEIAAALAMMARMLKWSSGDPEYVELFCRLTEPYS